ncbi:MAG: aminoglycoside phosphotransferase family protein [Kordiimonas sp.]
MVMTRLEQQQKFCDLQGWGCADIFPLPCDASKRSYTRLVDNSRSAMLMDAPPEFENLAAYMRLAGHLSGLGIRTPEIYAYDLEQGFAIIEDFGDDTFTRLLDRGVSDEALYSQAVDVLIHIQKSPDAASVEAPPYDEKLLLLEVERFVDWFVPAVRGADVTVEERDIHIEAWKEALQYVANERSMLVVRDFHVDNLMIVDGGEGLAACGLLDFQDALIGSAAYDVVSLVEDARRDVSAEVRALVLDKYFKAFPDLNRNTFNRDMAILGAQRHAKVLGLFARLSRQDDKHGYLKHVPRVARLLDRCLQIPELAKVREVIEALVPNYQQAEISEPLTSLYPKET